MLCTTVVGKAQIAIDDFEGGENEYLFNARTCLVKISVGYSSNLSLPKKTANNYYSLSIMQPSYSIAIVNSSSLFRLPKSYYLSYFLNFSYLRQLITLNDETFAKVYRTDKNTYHLSVFYGGLGLSLHKNFSEKFESYISIGYNRLFYGSSDVIPSQGSRGQISALLGLRYGINNFLSIFAEGGYDVQYAKVGLAFSL